jgi:small subunit ribosomal protein S16
VSVSLRLARYGRKKTPFYRIVATDNNMPRDGRYLELLGTLDPLADPPTLTLKPERAKYWISVGATPSNTVKSLLDREMPGYFEDILKKRTEKIQSKRAKRKAKK